MKYVLIIHGGAGAIRRDKLSAKEEEKYRKGLESALQEGQHILKSGGASIDAVQSAVTHMENNPVFNAGKGSVMTHDEEFELDASIMEGKERQAGAVCGLRHIANPILVAREVLRESVHVLLSGKGARRFAESKGFERIPQSYFHTEKREKQLEWAKKKDAVFLDHSPDEKYGTVGAVALDKSGNLAAATSTGGLTNKKWGRIGDSPLIGAGTWADNRSCAVSCTGHGEAFMRSATAYEVAARIRFADSTLEEAAKSAIFESIAQLGFDGGLIAVDHHGNIATPFNSLGMYRGYVKEGGNAAIEIF